MRQILAALLLVSLVAAVAPAARAQRDPAPTPALPPAEAVKKLKVPDGFEVRLFAAEPDVVNPVAMTWDDRGRLWVVELIDYPYDVKQGAKKLDRVKVLEDTDGDGKADKVTVFADGLNLATAIAVGNGGVYVGAAPNLWFMRDTNGDDVADEKKIILTGFGLEDRHELLNGFNWGPDGWLHMTQGVFTQSNVVDPEHPEKPPVKFNAGVVRFRPSDKKIELWADGISNQWGVDWDARGNAFVSACVVEHLWHVVPGGIYVRQGGIPGWPYAYDLLKQINDHGHFRAAYSGIQVYQGGAYPPEYDGTIFMGNIHGNCINHDKLAPKGSSFVGSNLHKGKDHVDDAFLNSTDGWFRPVSTQVGPDGNLWIMDWYDKYPCYQNSRAPDLDRSMGRIWRVVYTGKEAGKPIPSHPANLDLQKATDLNLVNLLKDKNVWMRRHAQRILSERKSPMVAELLTLGRDASQSVETRLAAFWTMNSAGLMNANTLSEMAADKDEAVRTWAARFAGEQAVGGAKPGWDVMAPLVTLAADKSAAVRAGVAQSAKRLAVDAGLDTTAVVKILLQQGGTAEDPQLPQLIWYAAEPLLMKDPKPLLNELVNGDEDVLEKAGPLVPRSIARRLYAAGGENRAAILALILEHHAKPITAVLLDGVLAGHKTFMEPPPDAEAFTARLRRSDNQAVTERATRLAATWGAKASVADALKIVRNKKNAETDRAAALKMLRGNKTPDARKANLEIFDEWRNDPVKVEALHNLATAGEDADAAAILKIWANPNTADVKRLAAETLSARPAWAVLLLEAIKDKKVDAGDLPLPALRNIADHAAKDDHLKKLMPATIGNYRPTPGDKQKVIEAKKAIVMAGTPDKARGRELFLKNCGVCHSLGGEGASLPVGPDLTGVGRPDLSVLLNNVIDPDQIIGAGYENTIVDTNDGDTKTGRVVEENDQYVKLLSAGPKEDVIPKKDIKERRTSQKSVMPEGFDQILKDDEFRDLIRYVLEAPAGPAPAGK